MKAIKKYNETVVSAQRLLQYFQLPDKNSHHISKYTYNFMRCFKIVVCLFHYFSWNTKRYSVEPSLRTLLDHVVFYGLEPSFCWIA